MNVHEKELRQAAEEIRFEEVVPLSSQKDACKGDSAPDA
jgi:hypothetical protein